MLALRALRSPSTATASTPMSFSTGERNQPSALREVRLTSGAGTAFTCVIFYKSASQLHSGFLLTAGGAGFQVSPNSELKRLMLVHNMPGGVEFYLGDSAEVLWGVLDQVLGGNCKRATVISGTCGFDVNALCSEVDKDLKLGFNCSKSSLQDPAYTNCIKFCRRMLQFIGQYSPAGEQALFARLFDASAQGALQAEAEARLHSLRPPPGGAEAAHPAIPDCNICLGDLEEPVSYPCGHSFCRAHITQWLQTNRTCPTCRVFLPAEVPA
jgi:hypothetical protein